MRKRLFLLTLAAAFLFQFFGFAQEPYKLPPKEVIDILDAPPTPRVTLNSARDTMLLVENESMPTIAYISQPMLRIAGIRITPVTGSVLGGRPMYFGQRQSSDISTSMGLSTTSIRRLRTASSPPTTSNRIGLSTPRKV